MVMNELILEYTNANGVDIVSKTFLYENLAVITEYTQNDELLYCGAHPFEEAPLQDAILNAYKLVKGKNAMFNSIQLVVGEKVVGIDKNSKPQDTLYEFIHYDEIHETAPEHLK